MKRSSWSIRFPDKVRQAAGEAFGAAGLGGAWGGSARLEETPWARIFQILTPPRNEVGKSVIVLLLFSC